MQFYFFSFHIGVIIHLLTRNHATEYPAWLGDPQPHSEAVLDQTWPILYPGIEVRRFGYIIGAGGYRNRGYVPRQEWECRVFGRGAIHISYILRLRHDRGIDSMSRNSHESTSQAFFLASDSAGVHCSASICIGTGGHFSHLSAQRGSRSRYMMLHSSQSHCTQSAMKTLIKVVIGLNVDPRNLTTASTLDKIRVCMNME